jgi:Transposase, Mutator family
LPTSFGLPLGLPPNEAIEPRPFGLAHACLFRVLSYNSEPSVLIRKRECPEVRRKAFIRKWRLKHCAVADSLEEAGDRLFTFTRLPPSQWRSARTTNAIERLHEEFKRRIKTSADTAAMLFWALLIAESTCAGDSSMPARKKLRNVILRPLIGAIFLKSGWNSGCGAGERTHRTDRDCAGIRREPPEASRVCSMHQP